MKYFNKLISISSESINSIKSVDLPVELKKLYREKNGFVAFESTFRIYDIDKILSQNRLDDLISILEEEERQDFLYDLNLVLNNREIEK